MVERQDVLTAESLPSQAAPVTDTAGQLASLVQRIETVFHGKRDAVELTLVAVLAQGHVLFEDVPGVGKTTLATTVARSLGCEFKRIQFTSDILPADIVGVNIYDRDAHAFSFKPGPLFANIVLADEINRTTPRSQSALLEAMNARQVTVDNTTHPLPAPFVVLATQNPLEFAGTYPLPESQLDRFLVRVQIGYPDATTERDIIRSLGFAAAANELASVLTVDQVVALQKKVTSVAVTDPVLGYLQTLAARTREAPYLALGVSTRGAIALFRACQALALLRGRDFVLPDDVKALFLPVCAHRVRLKSHHDNPAERRQAADNVLADILDATPVPV